MASSAIDQSVGRFPLRVDRYTAPMTLENALRWSWMNVLSAKRVQMLQDRFGDLDTALGHIGVDLLREMGCKEETAILAMNRLEEFDIAGYARLLRTRDITFLSLEDEHYPEALRTIADPPVFLYASGDLTVLRHPCVAIVGSRKMSEEGRRVVEHLTGPLVAAGCTTVSGLAYGVDAEVAKETLRHQGRTVAVLGQGLGHIYPKAHEKLAADIVKAGGLILSEFPMDCRADKFTFPARNRIIAGASLVTVVVEAAEESGSLITAELALEYGREVCAVPGSVFDPQHAGCHKIIASGQAKLVTNAADILQEIGMHHAAAAGAPPASSFTPENAEEASVHGALTAMPVPLDDLVVKAKLNAAVVSAVLTILEIKGAARNTGGGKWVRT